MQSKDGVRRGAQWSYDDEKRPAGFVYSLQWPLNEGGAGELKTYLLLLTLSMAGARAKEVQKNPA